MSHENVRVIQGLYEAYKYTPGYSNGYLVVMQAGDWMKYSINVTQPGAYTLQALVAWGGTGGVLGTFHMEIDGVDKTGPLPFCFQSALEVSLPAFPEAVVEKLCG